MHALESIILGAAEKIPGCSSKTCNEAVRGDMGLESLKSRRDRAKLKWPYFLPSYTVYIVFFSYNATGLTMKMHICYKYDDNSNHSVVMSLSLHVQEFILCLKTYIILS